MVTFFSGESLVAYFALQRIPDLMLARHVDAPSIVRAQGAKRLLKYLKGPSDVGLTLNPGKSYQWSRSRIRIALRNPAHGESPEATVLYRGVHCITKMYCRRGLPSVRLLFIKISLGAYNGPVQKAEKISRGARMSTCGITTFERKFKIIPWSCRNFQRKR